MALKHFKTMFTALSLFTESYFSPIEEGKKIFLNCQSDLKDAEL